MSAAAAWSLDPEWDPQVLVPAVASALVLEFDDRFRALGPVWLRTDPAGLLWIAAPLSVLVVASPSPLLRVIVAATVAVGVGLALRWQAALEAHQQRCGAFVDALAHQVASVLVSEVPPLIVEEIAMGQYRPGIEQPILHAAAKEAEGLRRINQGGWL